MTTTGERHEEETVAGPLSIGSVHVRVGLDGVVERAREALRDVYDPELCVDVVSLGLVYDIREEEETVVVEMTLTTPGCPASESLPVMAREAVACALEEGSEVDVRVVWDPPWSPEMMSEDVSEALGFRSR